MIEPRVILLEDDDELRSIVDRGLREEGFEVSTAGSAADLVRQVDAGDADALVVDIGLHDADGRDVVQALRARGVGVPVIFLTARDTLPDRLAGFASGGAAVDIGVSLPGEPVRVAVDGELAERMLQPLLDDLGGRFTLRLPLAP